MKHFFSFFLRKKKVFMCVSKRDEGFQCRALRRTQQRYSGLFIFWFTSNIPNKYNVRGRNGCHLCLSPFFRYQRSKSCGRQTFVCAGCRKQTLKFNTSCCYLFGKKKNMSAVSISLMLGLASLTVISCDVTGRL